MKNFNPVKKPGLKPKRLVGEMLLIHSPRKSIPISSSSGAPSKKLGDRLTSSNVTEKKRMISSIGTVFLFLKLDRRVECPIA